MTNIMHDIKGLWMGTIKLENISISGQEMRKEKQDTKRINKKTNAVI
jgi:hypothetical protein